MKPYSWKISHPRGLELSSKGLKEFSAFYARLGDGLSIEHHYQVNIKGYASMTEGKGKAPKNEVSDLWRAYLGLWREWFELNEETVQATHEFCVKNDVNIFTDQFASSSINQAHAMAVLFNEKYFGIYKH